MPRICRTRKESTFLQNNRPFYVIIHFIRSRINLLDLIIGNMTSNDEGQGSGDCDDVYRAADEFFSLTGDQQMLLLGPPVASGTETDTQTGAETETGAEIQTGIETGAETGAASGSGAGVCRCTRVGVPYYPELVHGKLQHPAARLVG